MAISGWKVFTLLACISATMCVVQAQAPTFVTCQNYLTPAAGVPLPLAVDFTLPTAEDSGGNTVEVVCSHQPGDRFPLGKTEVTCNATVGSDKSTCKFEVGVGDAANCTRGYKACTCISAIDQCTCKIGYSGVDCGVEDGTNCIDGDNPSPGCGAPPCNTPDCRCDNGWQGPSCDVVDDGSSCYTAPGAPPHCFACFAGDDPPCVCELGYQGRTCEKDYLPPAFLFCPADFFVQAADDEDSAQASWNDPTAEDNSGVAPTISCDHVSGSRFTAGSTRVTCTASDGENNMSHCTFNITVSDEKIPNITCPGNGVWNVDAESAFATVVLSPAPKAVDNIDGSVVVTCFGNLKPIGLPEDQYPVGETFVKCYANDSSANQASCSFTVTVLDNEGPVVTCPRNIVNNVEPGMPDAAVDWRPPTAEDVVEGPIPVVNCTDHNGKDAESGDRFPAGNITITCSAFDSVGNEGNCSFLITVNDNEAPIMTCPANISRNVDPGQSVGTIDWPTEPSANDTVDGPLAVTCYDDSDKVVNSGDEFSVRDTVVTCKASDASHNEGSCRFIITVIDNEDPLISCPESIFKDLEAGSAVGIIDWPTLPSANDIVDGPLAVTCHDESDKLVNSGDEFSVGVTEVTCIASDNSNNEANCSFTINLKDVEGPIVTCPDNDTENVEPGTVDAAVDWSPSPSAHDVVDGPVPNVTCADEGEMVESGGRFPIGETEVTCIARDSAQNEGNCSFFITVIDNESPIMSCPADITQDIDTGSAVATIEWPTQPSANDTVDGPLAVKCYDDSGELVNSGDEFSVLDTVVTCKASDKSDNEANCSFTITVKDIEGPVMACPGNISHDLVPGSSTGVIDWPVIPSANDTVDGPLPVTCKDESGKLVASGEEYPVGVTVVTCEASDGSTNKGSCIFVITVKDNEAPVMSCPADISQDVVPGEGVAIVDWLPLPSANDAVDGLLNVTCRNESGKLVNSGDEFPIGVAAVTCKSSDSSGNEANCSFTISVTECGGVQACENGGTFFKAFCNCSCPSPFIGKTCEACDPCQNGGNSQDPDTCVCQCPGGFTGPLCSECKECVNGGNQDEATCVCNCFNSFQGPLCDVCPSDMQCGNGGEFDETSCKCNCQSPWTGQTCTECTPCANDGSNQDPDTCICDCPGVFLPPVCAECGGVTECQNDGVFSDVFCNCTCLSPFTGKTCTECEPCQNGGSYQNKFTCVCDCPYFHTDPLCMVCPLEFVCLNGATRQEAACSCECADGWRGTDCSEPIPNIPDDEYPVSPIWTVSVEKKVSFEIAVIAPVDSGMECDPTINKFSNECNALVLEFKLSVEIEYKFVAGFSRVVIDQDKLRAGSVVVPHDVIYNYDEMTPTTRGISANALYEATVGKAVDRGYIGKLKVATGCQDCMAPQDKTYICDADPPECAAGLVLTQSTNGGVGTCYYVCWSKCKVDPAYCGDGTCHQESGSEQITCNCPQSSEVMYSGTQCQLQVQLVWLYVGVSLGGVLLLVLIIVLSVCLWRRRGKVHKFQDEDEEKEELHRPVSGKVIKELRSYHNDGNNRDMFFQEAATIPSHASPYAQVHKSRSSKAIKHGEANGAWKHGEANGAWPGALPRARARPLSEGQKDETKIKSSDFNGNEGGDRRSWYFWGSMSLPKKQPTEMIRMTSESGRF
ncbi:hyalin-like [Patiria miniata]|uniref:HYR domain-containing protein n=1 Tax=Patiria miniata TaxID=46514 RepID=A0A914B7A8_PATMI|nr:hyalin-like [Patiria miniata]